MILTGKYGKREFVLPGFTKCNKGGLDIRKNKGCDHPVAGWGSLWKRKSIGNEALTGIYNEWL